MLLVLSPWPALVWLVGAVGAPQLPRGAEPLAGPGEAPGDQGWLLLLLPLLTELGKLQSAASWLN